MVLQGCMSLRFLVAGYMHSVGRELNSQEVVLVVFRLFSMKVARVHAYSFKGELTPGSQPFMIALLLSVVLNKLMLGNLKQGKEALKAVETQEQFQVVTLVKKFKSNLTKKKETVQSRGSQ